MAPYTFLLKGAKRRPTGQDTIMGNYKIPKKNSNSVEEERTKQRLRDTRNLATGIEIALKSLLPDNTKLVRNAIWDTHASLAGDIEAGLDSSRTAFLGARVVDRQTLNGPARKNGKKPYSYNDRRSHDDDRNFERVPREPRSMARHWSVLDDANNQSQQQQYDRRDRDGPIGVSRPFVSSWTHGSYNDDSSSDKPTRSTYPYVEDPGDPGRFIGVPRPPLPAWASGSEKRNPQLALKRSAQNHGPFKQDPSDPDKLVGVPRPFEGRDQRTMSDYYTGAAFHQNRKRQVELGLIPSIYPDYWISGQTFGTADMDMSAARRLYEREGGGFQIGGAGIGGFDGVNGKSTDNDGDLSMAQELDIFTPTPGSVSESLIQVLDGFRIEDEIALDTAEAARARQNFFAELEEGPIPGTAPAASEGASENGALYSLPDQDDSKYSDAASTSMYSRLDRPSSLNPLLVTRMQKMQPYRTSSVAATSYAPSTTSIASDFDGPTSRSLQGTPAQRGVGRALSSHNSAYSKAPSTQWSYAGSATSRGLPFASKFDRRPTPSKAPSSQYSYAGSATSRNCPFESMFDAGLANAIDIPVLEPTLPSGHKSSLFAGHAANLRAPMSHNEKVSQWAAGIIPSGMSTGQPSSSSSRVDTEPAGGSVEASSSLNGTFNPRKFTPSFKGEDFFSKDLLEMAEKVDDSDMYAPPSGQRH
ncbi:hypothetical protein L873DRAFT_1872229 [Choiromyces venosus 120613-1]|uniref:Uncharacterized protein n=1 Tax=Choiromyces venosus 120613-1 TaxID=1336337 RepID=A0A3N4J1H1_9PEZI|nr:hypothetical protein L873DRAFT_1872229 [Choiromyces venosus 120613-1]